MHIIVKNCKNMGPGQIVDDIGHISQLSLDQEIMEACRVYFCCNSLPMTLSVNLGSIFSAEKRKKIDK